MRNRWAEGWAVLQANDDPLPPEAIPTPDVPPDHADDAIHDEIVHLKRELSRARTRVQYWRSKVHHMKLDYADESGREADRNEIQYLHDRVRNLKGDLQTALELVEFYKAHPPKAND